MIFTITLKNMEMKKYQFKGIPGPWELVRFGNLIVIKDGADRISLAKIEDTGAEKYFSAKLMSAAPELLDALIDCVSHIKALHGENDVPESAYKAIHKALNISE